MVYNFPKREGTLMNNHNFGSHLVSVRMRSGMTRFDLARKLGINYITIAKWESGELKPTADELLLLAAAFGTTPEVLLSGKPFNVVRTANQPVAPAISKPAPAPTAEKPESTICAAIKAEPERPETAQTSELADASRQKSANAEKIAAAKREKLRALSLNSMERKELNAKEMEADKSSIASSTDPVSPWVIEKRRAAYEEKLASSRSGGVRIRRIFAWILDWILVCAMMALTSGFAADYLSKIFDELTVMFVTLAIIAVFGALFLLRDLLFRRSLGKRIFRLVVIDKRTAGRAVAWQRLVRTLFAFIYEIDGIVLLVRGESIGDMVAGTAVVSKGAYKRACRDEREALAEYSDKVAPIRKRKSHGLITTVVALVILLALPALFVGVGFGIRGALISEMQTEEYAIAEDYLLESDAFAHSGAPVNDITFNSIETSVTSSQRTKTYGFSVDGTSFYVVLHEENGAWYVCDECTDFD